MNCINKEIVGRRFSKCAERYCYKAHVQRMMASKLAENVIGFGDFEDVLEVGCGSGFLTRDILKNHHPMRYYLNDLSEEMVAQASQHFTPETSKSLRLLTGDAELVDLPLNLDAIVSSAAIQWFQHVDLFFYKSARSLQRGGLLAFTTFGPDNFHEIKYLANKSLDYLSLQQLREMLEPNFEIHLMKEERLIQWFGSAVEVLDHIRQTGVNGLNNNAMRVGELREFIRNYNQQYGNGLGKVSLTWHPITVVATKKH